MHVPLKAHAALAPAALGLASAPGAVIGSFDGGISAGIAGIGRTTAAAVIGAGVEGIAVITAICNARDPRAASAELAAIVSDARGSRP